MLKTGENKNTGKNKANQGKVLRNMDSNPLHFSAKKEGKHPGSTRHEKIKPEIEPIHLDHLVKKRRRTVGRMGQNFPTANAKNQKEQDASHYAYRPLILYGDADKHHQNTQQC